VYCTVYWWVSHGTDFLPVACVCISESISWNLVIKICDIKFKLHFIQQHYLKRQPCYPLPWGT